MPQTVEVRFKGNRKGFFEWQDEADLLRVRDAVVVDADRGEDLGRISAVGETALKKCGTSCGGCAVGEAPSGDKASVLRRASRDEVSRHEELRRSEEDVRRQVIERVRAHGLADEGERLRVAVGPEEADGVFHRRKAGGLPEPGP